MFNVLFYTHLKVIKMLSYCYSAPS